jgi:molybdopterin-guanine dinucleotide biosynthesis protein B
MTPILSVVGYSDSGKTTYLERLIPELVKRNVRIIAVKHDVHGFEVDKPGKDSYRLKQAGAAAAIISSPKKIAVIADTDHDLNLSEIRDHFGRGADLILSEGYKNDIHSKIEVFRKGVHEYLLCTDDDTLFAVAADTDIAASVPVLPLDDPSPMADLIVEKILGR